MPSQVQPNVPVNPSYFPSNTPQTSPGQGGYPAYPNSQPAAPLFTPNANPAAVQGYPAYPQTQPVVPRNPSLNSMPSQLNTSAFPERTYSEAGPGQTYQQPLANNSASSLQYPSAPNMNLNNGMESINRNMSQMGISKPAVSGPMPFDLFSSHPQMYELYETPLPKVPLSVFIFIFDSFLVFYFRIFIL
jgi:hypothetical protein